MKGNTAQRKAGECNEFAELAVSELREAVKSAHSGFTTVATSKQWWMLANDVDLEELHGRKEFAQFERDIYPDGKPALARPHDSIPFELTSYDLQLIKKVSR